ncbi:MAG: GIY-YIG nuclease family protein [Bacillota bacterium]
MAHPLKDKLKEIPKAPGVYFWLDKNGEVLYVGRAVSLKNRLSQYFQKNLDARIAEMVGQAIDLKYIPCESLLEAIILEAEYIKKYWPKYNIVDRDDRSFIYVAIDEKADYPRPIIFRGRELKKFPSDKYRVFGPYQAYYLISSALRLLRRVFPYSTCTPRSGRPCFDYQIGVCPGACVEAISPEEYIKNIKKLILLLSGERTRLLKKLSKDNPEQARALRHLQEVTLLSREEDLSSPRLGRIEGYDISHFQGKESYASMVVFENGDRQSDEYRLFKIKEAPAGDDERGLLEVLTRRFKHEGWNRPDLVMIDGGSPQISFLSRELGKINIHIPMVGISKFGGDRLVFTKGVSKQFKELASVLKPTLLKVREEAHRFANYGRRRAKKPTII